MSNALRVRARSAALGSVLVLSGCASTGGPGPEIEPVRDRPGVLVMAHGGGAEWNGRVEEALKPLRARIPVALALGMADPGTMQSALDSLHDQGVNAVAVVRLFVSGASFLHPTEFLLGLRPDPPERAMVGHRMVAGRSSRRSRRTVGSCWRAKGWAGPTRRRASWSTGPPPPGSRLHRAASCSSRMAWAMRPRTVTCSVPWRMRRASCGPGLCGGARRDSPRRLGPRASRSGGEHRGRWSPGWANGTGRSS